jgi:hypothetical protein
MFKPEAHRVTRNSLEYWTNFLQDPKILVHRHHNRTPKVGDYITYVNISVDSIVPGPRPYLSTIEMYYVLSPEEVAKHYDAELVWKRSFAGPKYILTAKQ